MEKQLKRLLLATSITTLLAACGGGGGGDPTEPPANPPATPPATPPAPPPAPPAPTNQAPSHTGDLAFTYAETASDVQIDLLAGASDPESSTLTVTNLVAHADNPASGVTVSGTAITVSPQAFVDELNDGDTQSIAYTYDISDGELSVARALSVDITGASPAPAPTASVITVNPLTQQFYGDVSELQRNKFFNYHGSILSGDLPDGELELLQDVKEVSHGRQFWSPMSAARAQIAAGAYPTTQFAQSNGPNSVNSFNNNPRSSRYSNRIVVTDHPRNVMTDFNDPVEGARWAADYFEHYYSDDSRPRFYEPMNEPYVHAGDFTANYNGSQEQVREAMNLWHKEIGKAFDSNPALANVNIIGYSAAWPSLEFNNFNHWNDFMKTFMDTAGAEVDAFSTHLYDGVNIAGQETQRSGSNSQAILDMIETYSWIKFDQVKPHAITEFGNIVQQESNSDGDIPYDPVANAQTIKSFNFIMMELLEREERVLTSIPFIGGTADWYWKDPAQGNGHPYNPSMYRPNQNNIELVNNRWEFTNPNAPDNFLKNVNTLFFDFWEGVNGKRAAVENLDPDVQSVAFYQGDTLHVILTNLETEDKSVQFNLAEMTGYNMASVTVDRLTVPQNTAPVHTSETMANTNAVDGNDLDFGTVTLAPAEAIKFTVTFNQDITPTATAQRHSYYSDTYLQTISANTAITFPFESVDVATLDAAASSAMVRLSIGRAHERSKAPVLRVNGTLVSVPDDWAGYDQADRDLFFGAIDIPVPHNLITANTNVVVTFPDAGGHVSSVVLEVNNTINPAVPTFIDIENDFALLTGETKQVRVAVLPFIARNVPLTWDSSDDTVATVSDTGLVTAIAAGTAVITATTPNSLSDSTTVTVSQPDNNLMSGANGDFEADIDPTVLRARNESMQVNLATFSRSVTAKNTGDYGLEVDNSPGSLKLQFTAAGINRAADPTLNYEIKADFKVVSGTHAWWTFIEGGPGGWKTQSLADTSDWQTLTIQYTGAQLGSSFGLNFHLDPASAGSGGVVYVDNVTITPVN